MSLNKGTCGNVHKKLNVLFVSDCDYKYGASHSLVALIKNLCTDYNDIDVTGIFYYKNRIYQSQLEKVGCRCIFGHYQAFYQAVPMDKWKYPIKYLIRFLQYHIGNKLFVHHIGRLIDFDKIDIIHSNSSREDIGAILAEKYHKPLVWHIREFGDRDYDCFSLRDDYIDYMNRLTTRFIAVSETVKQHWIKKGLSADRIRVVYNGVDCNKDAETKKDLATSSYLDTSSIIKFVHMGSLNKTKGQAEVIEALHLLRMEEDDIAARIHVDFIGDGKAGYEKELLGLVEKYGLQDVITFKGYVEKPQEILRDYDVGLMCSRSEAFGRVTAEYMMAGLTVIASDAGANRELVRDGVDGKIYPQGNCEELKETIKHMYENIQEVIMMGKNGRIRAKEMFTVERYTGHVRSIYEEILLSRISN